MQEPSLTPKATLLDERLRAAGKPGLIDTVVAGRTAGQGWRKIAAEVEEISGFRVTETGLRYWMAKAGVGDPAPEGAAA